MANIGIFYGSTVGNTEKIAETIQKQFGKEAADVSPISKASISALSSYPYLVLGSSTWGIGELQDDWLQGIELLDHVDFSTKKVALFGTGDQQSYSDSFCDAIGILYEKVVSKGATVVGFCSTEGYSHDASKAEQNGMFVGLPLDEDNQGDLTERRITQWVETLHAEFN